MPTYTKEKSIQILLCLMKKHNIRKVIASPGSTNISFVISMQNDPYYEMYSAPDERSAAYMACGLAAESREPVVLTCTGATASRNYIPGLTEAYYRNLPVLAVTSTQHMGQIGQHIPQVLDRTVMLNDIVKKSVQIPMIHDEMDEWSTNLHINDALLELRHRGGGPVHINLATSYPFYPNDFSEKKLPDSRMISRIENGDKLPPIDGKKIAIFVGNHVPMEQELVKEIDSFCSHYNAVVLCDQTSNYTGKYAISSALVLNRDFGKSNNSDIDILIHIGEVSGAYLNLSPKRVWRVNPDGVIRDTFRKLQYVFEYRERDFFVGYNSLATSTLNTDYYNSWKSEYDSLYSQMPDVPFSNIWVTGRILNRIPSGSKLYLGILNSLRAANFFPIRNDIECFSNTGGFGIDGGTSSLLGGALSDTEHLHFGVFGDLAFFYDMNALGNRHLPSTVRIILVNNGKGTEFRNYTHFASEFHDDADTYIAAGGHYGNKSRELVKHYAEDLGFVYLSAENKEEFEDGIEFFCSKEFLNKPLLFEVFTTNIDENDALRIVRNIGTKESDFVKLRAKKRIKRIIGEKRIAGIKKIIGRYRHK